MTRSAAAVLVGYFLLAVSSAVKFWLIRQYSPEALPAAGEDVFPSTGWLLALLGSDIALMIAAGYITAWVALRRPVAHAVVLGAVMVVLGIVGAVTAARRAGGFIGIPAPPLQFLAIPFADMVLFALFVGLAVVKRRDPQSHKRLMVIATLELARAIVLEATLSFLGLGIQPPTPSWGGMIHEGREYLDSAWWISVCPGVLLMLTSLVVSRTGDWLRDFLDPTLRGES